MIGIRGKRRSLITSNQEDILHTPSQQIKAKINSSIHNRFDIEVVDAKSGEVKQKAYAENVICSQLWSKLLSTSYAYFSYIHYGTGTGTPNSSDTSLFTFLGYGSISESTEVVTSDYSNCVFSARRQITLSETTAVGSILTEVGIASGTTASTLCTHAMLKDMNGNQISITKTNTDIINIYATIYIHYSSDFLSMNGYVNVRMGSTFLRYLAGMYVYGTSENNYAKYPDYAFVCRGKSFLSALYSSGLATPST